MSRLQPALRAPTCSLQELALILASALLIIIGSLYTVLDPRLTALEYAIICLLVASLTIALFSLQSRGLRTLSSPRSKVGASAATPDSPQIGSRQSFGKSFGAAADHLRARADTRAYDGSARDPPLQPGVVAGTDTEGSGLERIPAMSRVRLPAASLLPPPQEEQVRCGALLPYDGRDVRDGRAFAEPKLGDGFLGGVSPESAQCSDPRPRPLPPDARDGAGSRDDFRGGLWGARQADHAQTGIGTAQGYRAAPDASALPTCAMGWPDIRRNVRRAVQGASHAVQPPGPSRRGPCGGPAGFEGETTRQEGDSRLPTPHLPATFAESEQLRCSLGAHMGAGHASHWQRPAGRPRRRVADADEREERASGEKSAGSKSVRPPQIRRACLGRKGSQRDLLARTRLEVTLNKLRKGLPAAEGFPAPVPAVLRRQGSCAPAVISPKPRLSLKREHPQFPLF